MRGGAALIAAVLASMAVAACGSDESKFSDDKIASAIGAKNDEVGGDPFCVVKDYLNDAAEVDKAGNKDGPAISSAVGNIGVVVVPPFPEDCARDVRKGLDKLDPRKDPDEDG